MNEAGFCRMGNSLKLCSHCADESLRRNLDKGAVCHPLIVEDQLVAALERIGAEFEQFRHAQIGEVVLPNADALMVLLFKNDLPVVNSNGNQLAVVVPVEELPARVLRFSFEERHKVVAVEVDLEGLVADLSALADLLNNVRVAAGCGKSGDQVVV